MYPTICVEWARDHSRIGLTFDVNWSTVNGDMREEQFFTFFVSTSQVMTFTLGPQICSPCYSCSGLCLHYIRSLYGFPVSRKSGRTDIQMDFMLPHAWNERYVRRRLCDRETADNYHKTKHFSYWKCIRRCVLILDFLVLVLRKSIHFWQRLAKNLTILNFSFSVTLNFDLFILELHHHSL